MRRLQTAELGGILGMGYALVDKEGGGGLMTCQGVFHPGNGRGADALRRMHGEEARTVFTGVVYVEQMEYQLEFEATITDAHIGGDRDTIHFIASGNPFDHS